MVHRRNIQDRRAVSTTLLVFELAATAIVITAFILAAKRAATGEDIRQRFLAEDAALTIDALHAVPGTVTLQYPTGNFSEGLKLSALDGVFTLYRVTSLPPTVTVPYRQDQGVSLAENEVDLNEHENTTLVFTKKDNLISFVQKIGVQNG